VFMREGFAQGSMDAVAAEAGVGKQTIYRTSDRKETLVEARSKAMCAPEVVPTANKVAGGWASGFANCC